jgi:DNA primase
MLVASGFGHSSSTFPADFKEQVRSRTDLVALVGESVALTPKGPHDYVGLCPFHDDHNPSFHVYPDRQAYRCWVCDEGGDCFSYVMKLDKLGFREALEQLAERANLQMPQGYGAKKPEEKNRQVRLLEILFTGILSQKRSISTPDRFHPPLKGRNTSSGQLPMVPLWMPVCSTLRRRKRTR